MACSYCAAMRGMSLPDHRTEIYMESLRECDGADGGALPEWIRERLPSDHDFPTVWAMRRYIRKEHIRWHRQQETTCAVVEALKEKLGEAKLLELTAEGV